MYNIDTLKCLKLIDIVFIIEDLCFKGSIEKVGRKERKMKLIAHFCNHSAYIFYA